MTSRERTARTKFSAVAAAAALASLESDGTLGRRLAWAAAACALAALLL